jgi:hypothetical protein
MAYVHAKLACTKSIGLMCMPNIFHVPHIASETTKKNMDDKVIKPIYFKEGHLALSYDSRFKYFKGNLRTKQHGP